MPRLSLSDLPPHLRDQVLAKLGTLPPPPVGNRPPDGTVRKYKGPNKTESCFRRDVLDRDGRILSIAYEALTFRMANGHRYTPDWVCTTRDGTIEFYEVKGAYRLGSYQRARLAFDQAATEWPCFTWIWAERNNDHGWVVKRKGGNSNA